MSDQNYTAIHGLMELLRYQNNAPADGTGINLLVKQAHNLLGPNIPDVMIDYTLGYQINLFGNYPTKTDIVPSAIFTAVFGIIAIAHLFVFIMNTSRGHYFYISLGWIFYCIMRIIGFAMRIAWANDITNTQVGIGGEVFLILPSILIVSLNLILAQRIFTWRHPVGGSRKLFWGFMFTIYAVVIGVIVMTIIFSAVPYIYFLSEARYKCYQKAVEASAILIILYSLTSMSLLSLAYFFKPTKKDENLYTYQPWWIESFSPFYYVKKNAAIDAAETFMKRNHNHRHAIRVIAATHHHSNMVEGLSNQRGDLKHNYSLGLLLVSTLFIFVGAICRAIVVFQGNYKKDSSAMCNPIAMYICWGALEAIIHVLYLVGRVDLRFYRPDKLPKKVRSIITAEQSLNVSDVESESEEYDGTDSETNVDFRAPVSEKPVIRDNESEFRF
ncbi:hypothetical protein CAAN4_A09318 [[Candida] anglica]|uniref:Uncharacterized protein n=1 Tax=[Candida] anglica TaxID=148631 RepID=A0ABP0E694_9ASCO